MQFSKAQKVLHDTNNFNPPPGYYLSMETNATKPSTILNTNFSKQDRFNKSKQIDEKPGPGHYYNDKAEKVRKRIVQQAKRKQMQFKANSGNESEIKISSIPSIPKKSTTRVYEQLAPGILILHQQQNEGTNIGPGSYNINSQIGHKKVVSHKINPEHKKKIEDTNEPQIKIPTIAEQLRNQKRQLYKRNLIKTTGLNKNMISPSDLCLEVIILRQKLLRSEENPPPGYYYNQKYQSSFKQADPDLLPEYQLMMGKQQRFKQPSEEDLLGPGAYELRAVNKNISKGGYIPKTQGEINKNKNPGPGSYRIESYKPEPTNSKANYPPIFGSGSNRFHGIIPQSNQTPGPGSYKVQKPRQKKQKYVKIKKAFYESQIVKPVNHQQDNKKQLISLTGDKSRSHQTSFFKQRNNEKNNHYFSSKVQRFSHEKGKNSSIGPGDYQMKEHLLKESFNRNKDTYTGAKHPRFQDVMIRPNLGPGTYFSGGLPQ